MYCPSCGTELPPSARFCSECGLAFENGSTMPAGQPTPTIAPRRSPPRPQPVPSDPITPPVKKTGTTKPRHKAGKIIVSVILVLVLIGAGFAIVTVMTWGSYRGSATYAFNPAVPSISDTWVFNADDADLDIKYTTNSSAPEVRVDIRYDFAGGFLAGKTPADLYAITWNNVSATKEFAMVTKAWWSFPMFRNNLVTVTIKSGININITASTGTGFAQMTVPDNENITALSVRASTGNAKVILGKSVHVSSAVTVHASTGSATLLMGDGSTVDGKLDIASSTGSANIMARNGVLQGGLSVTSSTGTASLTLNATTVGGGMVVETSTGNAIAALRNITLSTNLDLNVSVSTGSAILVVDQVTNPGGNMSARIKTSTGSVYITYKGDDLAASAKFTTSTGTGNSHFTNTGGFTTISATEFRSDNYPGPSRFDANVSASTGSIYITGQMI